MRYGNKVGDAIHYRNGVYETRSPIVLAAAQRDLNEQTGTVESIGEAALPQVQAPAEPIPPAPKLCNQCKVLVEAVDWAEHIMTHGRSKRKHA